MNKRKEPISARVEKKVNKEVHKGMKDETALSPKMVEIIKVKAVKKIATHKKISKRTATHEGVEGSTPAHVHTENEHWAQSLRKKTLLQASRLRKKQSKLSVGRGRMS